MKSEQPLGGLIQQATSPMMILVDARLVRLFEEEVMDPAPIPRHPQIIIVITILMVLQGILELALAALVLSGSIGPVSVVAETSLAWGGFVLLLAWGVWKLKLWSFWMVVVLQVLTLGVAVVDLLELRSVSGSIALVVIGDILLPLIVLLLFWRNRLIHALLRS